jgi:sulfopropanediol 3-dehydrogenase
MAEYLKNAESTTRDNDAAHQRVREAVRAIIEDVASNGLDAIRRYSLKFDKYESPSFKLSPSQIASIVATVDSDTKADIAFAQTQIRNFAEAQRAALRDVEVQPYPGVFLGHRNIPVDSAACYIPGGRYPLVASAHMGIVTAKVAGVRRVVALTPPVEGRPHPAMIAAAEMAGADEIHLIGGAHALAAAAYGTIELAPVDMIVGPGNAYVAEAKRQLFGRVGIDLFAGPTEVVIIADETADAETVAVDLLGQAEHGYDSPAVLITTSRKLGLEVLEEIKRQLETLETAPVARAAWRDHGKIILVVNAAEAVAESDKLASEHVQVFAADLDYYLKNLRQYGALFLGEMTCVAYGDKVIGTNHTLPTRGAARYTGGLWVGKFLKTCTYQRIASAASSVMFGEYGSRLCLLENFAGHKRQNDLRVENFGNRPRSPWRKKV